MSHVERAYTVAELEADAPVELQHFTKEDAFELGTIAAGVIVEWQLSLAVDIVLGDELVYRARFKRTHSGNDEFLAGKAAVAREFDLPSLRVRLAKDAEGIDTKALNTDTHKYYGGSIPLHVAGEIVATITLSGEADSVDHEVAAEAVARYIASLG
jgi:uncharacterized protein (UPF0303 family)